MSVETDQLKKMGITLEENVHPMEINVTRDYQCHDIVNLKLMIIPVKPERCPFCDSADVNVNGPGCCYVTCSNCSADGPEASTEKDAIKLWNNGCDK
jgi:hypothetical protein